MKKYINKPKEVYAERVSIDNIDAIKKITVGYDVHSVIVSDIKRTMYLIITKEHEVITAYENDYIILDKDNLFVMNYEEFKSNYEEIWD